MESSDQTQRPSEGAVEQNLTPSADQPVVAPSGVYPPPYYPPSAMPTMAMAEASPPPVSSPAQQAQGRMARSETLDLLSRLKATLVAGSLLALGMFAALAAAHVTGVTSRASSASQPAGGAQNSQTAPAATAPSSDSGNFFNQNSSSGFGIGPPSSQAPSTGTSVS